MEGPTGVSESVSEIVPGVVSEISSQGVKRCASRIAPGIPCRIFSFCKSFVKEYKTVIIATVAVVAVVKVHRAIKRRKYREEWNSAGKDVVIVHGFNRAIHIPNISPFVIKLETYLRMADIQYKYDDKEFFGPKGKCPWITFNGKDYGDSQLIIEFLGREFQKDFSSSLTEEERAVSKAMEIMADEHVIWCLFWWRFVKDHCQEMISSMKWPIYYHILMRPYIRQLEKRLWMQGFGRHSDDEKIEIIRKDFEAFSKYLGAKKFLNGDNPCEVDCSIFGMLSQFVWASHGSPFQSMIKNDYPNLLQYCYRMKEKFWPDWEQQLLK